MDGTIVSSDDPRFRDKVVIVEIFGTWCPTCHDSAPAMVALYERYRDRGLEIVGLAYEVTGDPRVDGAIVRRYRDKFGITYPLLLAGVNDGTSPPGETQPQLDGPHRLPDDDLPGPLGAGPPGARRLLRTRTGRGARGAGA